MSKSSRRAFLGQLGAAAAVIPELRPGRVGAAPSPAAALPQTATSSTPSVSYDLLIAGGRVVDPSQKLSAERDVAIAKGRIARIAANIPRTEARQVFEAKGKIVTPGVIDIHSHVYKYGITTSIDPDHVGINSGVTTIVDAGSTGAGMFLGFRKYVIDGSTTRIYALVNISAIGCCANEIYLAPTLIDPKTIIGVIEANRDVVLGVKVRVRGRHEDLARDVEVMKQARTVADATGTQIMLHWTNEPDVLALLKRGDILTHPFNPPSTNSANLFGADGTQADKVLPQILALKDRGIWTDGQAATTHHAWAVSEKAAQQGWFPDAISTDMASNAPNPPGPPINYRPDYAGYRPNQVGVPWPMAHFLHLGLSLEQVIERVTTNPAKMLNFPEKIGTLEPGVTADVSIFDFPQGSFEFRDGAGQTRTGKQQFVPVATLRGGIFVKGSVS
jgi:dihydroorotase